MKATPKVRLIALLMGAVLLTQTLPGQAISHADEKIFGGVG